MQYKRAMKGDKDMLKFLGVNNLEQETIEPQAINLVFNSTSKLPESESEIKVIITDSTSINDIVIPPVDKSIADDIIW